MMNREPFTPTRQRVAVHRMLPHDTGAWQEYSAPFLPAPKKHMKLHFYGNELSNLVLVSRYGTGQHKRLHTSDVCRMRTSQ
jgi:hypothetical protein